jgi:hypothetical protein
MYLAEVLLDGDNESGSLSERRTTILEDGEEKLKREHL